MIAIVVSVNIFLIALVCIFAFVLGYLVRARYISKCKKRIYELEREMLRDNARILELEKEKVDLLRSKNGPFTNQP